MKHKLMMLALAVAGASAQAQPVQGHEGRREMSREEYLSRANERFGVMDVDHDGVVSRKEHREFRMRKREEREQRREQRREERDERMEKRADSRAHVSQDGRRGHREHEPRPGALDGSLPPTQR